MKNIRIIPRLDIKGPNLVKGIHLEGLRVMGKPSNFANYYYEQGADELIYQDTVASLYERNSLNDLIAETSKDIFIPLTVGGGIRSLNDIYKVLRSGADKAAINTAAIKNPNIIDDSSKEFGSSTIVIAIETIKQEDGKYLAFTDNGREFTGINALEWAREVENRGAGEILLTSIDHEGTGNGFDLNLLSQISEIVKIPIIIHGGASNSKHISDALLSSKVDAFALASMLHYEALKNKKFENTFSNQEGNTNFIDNQNSFSVFGKESLAELKNNLQYFDLDIRTIP